jgi:hypothetical protein
LTDDRLPTELWIMAHVRRVMGEGIPATIVHRGDADAGGVLLKLYLGAEGCRLLNRVSDAEGRLAWMAALNGKTVPEAEADAYIQRQRQRDPDLWVVEIEDRLGRNPFEGKVV